MLGAAGGIGQPLSLLLKNSPYVGELSLYDVANTAGVACDLSHISTGAKVKGYTGPAQLQEALHGCQLVVIPAGVVQQQVPVSACNPSCCFLVTLLYVRAVPRSPWQHHGARLVNARHSAAVELLPALGIGPGPISLQQLWELLADQAGATGL